MSIATAIENARQKVANCYTSVDNMGGTLPATQNLSNLPAAIESISTGDTVTIAGSDVPYGQKALIRFDTSRQAYLTSFYNAYTYTGTSNGDGTFKIALPDPLPYLQNYVVNGNVSIADNLDGTGWGTSNYLSNIIEPLQEVNLEIICKAYWNHSTGVQVLHSYLGINNNGLFSYTGQKWSRPNTSDTPSGAGEYWFKVRVVNGIAFGSFIKDNNYTEETLPSSGWSYGFIANKNTEGLNFTVGQSFGDNGSNWASTIHLDTLKIYVLDIENGTKQLTWQMYSPFNLTLPDTQNPIPSGDWTIKTGQGTPQDATGVLQLVENKGVSSFKYSPTYYYPCAKTFRWNLAGAKSAYVKGHIKTQSGSWSSSTNYPVLCYTTNTYANPMLVYVHGGNKALSGSWGTIIPNIATNTEYWFEATLDNQGNRTVKYSTDGETWTTTSDTAAAPTWQDYTDVPCIGYWGNANFYWGGTIYDLETGYVDANDETHTFKLWK